MRYMLATALLLTPMIFVAPAVASQPKDDTAASTQEVLSNNGVTVPQLIHSARISVDSTSVQPSPFDINFVLKLDVDETGEAQGIHILKSANPTLNANVIEAVRQFRWQPATLHNQTVAFKDLTLNILVQR